MLICGTTQLLGLIGDPVAHSLSPVIHNAALQSLGQDWVYLPFPVKADHLPEALAGLWVLGVQGVNVTIPHKQAVIPHMQEVAEDARAIGAVNTILRTERGWAGANTDVLGFMAPLLELRQEETGKTATILGSGGSARAVIQGCSRLGFSQIQVVGRSPRKLADLQATWPQIQTCDWQQLDPHLPDTDLLVNTTPVGMDPQPQEQPLSPLTSEQIQLLPEHAVVYDLIYTPNPTELVRLSRERNLIGLDGLEMLIQQGAASLAIWLQTPSIPVAKMRQAARQQLGLA
ncbi:MAG: shikimate dehydrogenase [Synechococcaceae cyanobacterium SM2_3_1]|nr:shikimate dehydrogenase [Synechococcaceae cyanobacterium SM2_3_1]